jgi:tellurite resistance protein TehA-like permease
VRRASPSIVKCSSIEAVFLNRPCAVPLITEAAVGSTLCKLLLAQNRHTYCLTLLIASYLCAGIGMLLAAAVIVLYLQRLLLHHLPPREVIVSSWLPVGPIGQGGFAIIELVSGRGAFRLLLLHPSRACAGS